MKKFIGATLILLLIISGIVTFLKDRNSDDSEGDDNKIIEALADCAVTLQTVNPEEDLEDLMFLKNVLKDKKIVAMGEATHGTNEFFKMKHRILRFLVEEMGYRTFAMEIDFGAGQYLNDYIQGGEGKAINGLRIGRFWTWRTAEVVEMIEWMREYNSKVSDSEKIKFYGFDIQ